MHTHTNKQRQTCPNTDIHGDTHIPTDRWGHTQPQRHTGLQADTHPHGRVWKHTNTHTITHTDTHGHIQGHTHRHKQTSPETQTNEHRHMLHRHTKTVIHCRQTHTHTPSCLWLSPISGPCPHPATTCHHRSCHKPGQSPKASSPNAGPVSSPLCLWLSSCSRVSSTSDLTGTAPGSRLPQDSVKPKEPISYCSHKLPLPPFGPRSWEDPWKLGKHQKYETPLPAKPGTPHLTPRARSCKLAGS